MDDKKILKFIEWIGANVPELKGQTPDQIMSTINELASTQEGQQMLEGLVQEFESASSQMFKKGGKLNYLLCLKSGGNVEDCGCGKKIKKAEGGTTIETGEPTSEEDLRSIHAGTYRKAYTDKDGNQINVVSDEFDSAYPNVYGLQYQMITPQLDTMYRIQNWAMHEGAPYKLVETGWMDNLPNLKAGYEAARNYYPKQIETIKSIPPVPSWQEGGQIKRTSSEIPMTDIDGNTYFEPYVNYNTPNGNVTRFGESYSTNYGVGKYLPSLSFAAKQQYNKAERQYNKQEEKQLEEGNLLGLHPTRSESALPVRDFYDQRNVNGNVVTEFSTFSNGEPDDVLGGSITQVVYPNGKTSYYSNYNNDDGTKLKSHKMWDGAGKRYFDRSRKEVLLRANAPSVINEYGPVGNGSPMMNNGGIIKAEDGFKLNSEQYPHASRRDMFKSANEQLNWDRSKTREAYKLQKEALKNQGYSGSELRQRARYKIIDRAYPRAEDPNAIATPSEIVLSDKMDPTTTPYTFNVDAPGFATPDIPTYVDVVEEPVIEEALPQTNYFQGEFKDAFKRARKAGLKEFIWDDPRAKYGSYHTGLRQEKSASQPKEESGYIQTGSATATYPQYIAKPVKQSDGTTGYKMNDLVKMAMINNAYLMK